MILVDTSVLSSAFRRRVPGPKEDRLRGVLEALLEGETSLGIPGLVLQEVLSGIRSEAQFARLDRRLRPSFSVLLPTEDDFVAAARLLNRCRRLGLSASGPDCLIASQAMAGGHELFTVDQDFEAIAAHAPLRLYALEPEA